MAISDRAVLCSAAFKIDRLGQQARRALDLTAELRLACVFSPPARTASFIAACSGSQTASWRICASSISRCGDQQLPLAERGYSGVSRPPPRLKHQRLSWSFRQPFVLFTRASMSRCAIPVQSVQGTICCCSSSAPQPLLVLAGWRQPCERTTWCRAAGSPKEPEKWCFCLALHGQQATAFMLVTVFMLLLLMLMPCVSSWSCLLVCTMYMALAVWCLPSLRCWCPGG